MSGNTTYFGIQYPSSSDYVKDGATAIQTVATGFDSAVAIPTYNAQTGTTYTFALTDIGKTVTASNAASQTYTIPPQASVVWVANTTLNVTNLGAGVVTFAGGAGVTVTNTANTLSQYQSAQLIRTGSNAWTVVPTSGKSASPGLTLISTTSFSAVSSISLAASSFTATYRNYKLVVNATYSTSTNLRIRLRAAGADNTTSNYGIQNFSANNTTLSGARGTAMSFFDTQQANQNDVTGEIDFYNPQTVEISRMKYSYSNGQTSSEFVCLGNGNFNATTSFDSATLIPAAGTITGSCSLYGLNV